MQGKILGDGVISGNDGNRYTYKPSELKNAKDAGSLVGSEVDFEIKDDKASEVYITKKALISMASYLAMICQASNLKHI